jgi:hypothetical protein
MLYSIVATSLVGSFVIAALVMGYDTMNSILLCGAIGAVAAVPFSYWIARKILTNVR